MPFRLLRENRIPDYTLNNTSTTDAGYIYSSPYLASPTTYDPTQTTSGYHWSIAVWNATDNIGKTIRSSALMNPIAIYSIGYTGDGGVDVNLLKRLANTQDAYGYDSSQQTGSYVNADTTTELTSAFSTVASELLRLASSKPPQKGEPRKTRQCCLNSGLPRLNRSVRFKALLCDSSASFPWPFTASWPPRALTHSKLTMQLPAPA